MLPLLFLACTGQTPETVAVDGPPPPNLVLVVVDTLRADRLGLYGYERPTSPNIDRVAANGMVFDRAYSHSGWTLASFASLYSGLLPHQHQATRVLDLDRSFGFLRPEVDTLAETLNDRGYRTANFSNNSFLDRQFGLDQGFDVYDNAQQRTAMETTDQALDWLRAESGPSFVVIHWFEPHMSYGAPEPFLGRFADLDDAPVSVPFSDYTLSRRWKNGEAPAVPTRDFVSNLYDEEILAVDQAFAHLMEGLGTELEGTRLAFTADHGEEFWDHGGFEHGHTLNSELIRVPLFVVGADVPTTRSTTLVSHQDLYTTLVGWGGAEPASGTAGLDLTSLAGADLPARAIISEGLLYGGDEVSLIRRTHRLRFDLVESNYRLFCVNRETLIDHECVDRDEDWRRLQESMYQELHAMRGNTERVRHTRDMLTTPDRDTEEQLRAVGYLE